MDWDVTDTSVVVVGAGFSAAVTDGQMPLMAGFFDQLTREDFPDLLDFVTEVGCNQRCPTIQHANVERVLLALEQVRRAPSSVVDGWISQFRENHAVIQQQLTNYTLHRLKNPVEIKEDNWACDLLTECGFRTTVISMNYDNLAESLLSCRQGNTHGDRNPTCPHCRMRLLLNSACSCDIRSNELGDLWRGAILKPHGSIAWRRCLNEDCCNNECLVADQRCQAFVPCQCDYCDTECAPVMVLPTMSKNLDEIPEIGVMWQACRAAIENAESILFFGFSLTTSDELFMQLIRSACGKGGKLRRVGSIDLQPEAVLERFEDCLPVGSNVASSAFPVTKGEVPTWYQPSIGMSSGP